jgi:hypothetical protein
MASFSINIFDLNDPEAATIFEDARAGTMQKIWQGKDDKMLNIIGSSLQFTMRAEGSTQGHFSHLFTYDERRYLVTQNDADTGQLIWQGYLLPEQYDEPYTNSNVWVRFTAADGLGALKYQFLDPQDYEGEMTISQAIAKCLQLTGIQANINVAPAITNVSGNRWDQQWIDMAKYVDDKGENDSAYEILSAILKDLLCCIFQEDGQWYVYGFNKRPLLSGTYWLYDWEGNFIQDLPYSKTVRSPRFYGVPVVGVNTPRRVIKARHKLVSNAIDENTYKYKNPGFVLVNPQDLICHKWIYTDIDFTAKFNSNDGRVYIGPVGGSYNSSVYVEIRKPLLLIQGEKVQWSMEFTSAYSGTESWGNDVETLVVDGAWNKILIYDIFYVDPATGDKVVLFSNQNGPGAADERYQVKFDRDRKASISIQMTVPTTAHYNIRFYKPINTVPDIKTDKIYIDKLELAAIAATDEKLYQDIIPQTYTQGIDVELEHHDDLKDYQNTIRMQQLGPTGQIYDDVTNAGHPTFERDGKHYLAVNLSTALIIEEHPKTVYSNGDNLRILGVHYDFPSDGSYAAEYDADLLGRVIPNGTETLLVQLRKYADIPSDISQWVQWADDVYQISYQRYGDAVVEILRNLYQTPHPKIRTQIRGLISMRDLILFQYQGDKVFYPTDINQLLDQNRTEVKISQNMYGQAVTAPDGKLPPAVNAGPDFSITQASSSTTLTATASDPDGTIVSVLWEVISGDGSPVIVNPDQLSTQVTGLTGDSYIFRITVTDNDGLTASDDVVVSRATVHNIDLVQNFDGSNTDLPMGAEVNYVYDNNGYELRWNPELPDGVRVRVIFDAVLIKETPYDSAGARPTCVLLISNKTDVPAGPIAQVFDAGSYRFEAEMKTGDWIDIAMNVRARNTAVFGGVVTGVQVGDVRAFIQLDITAEVVAGSAALSGIPIQLTAEAIQ